MFFWGFLGFNLQMPDTKLRPRFTMKSKDKSSEQRFGHVNATNHVFEYHYPRRARSAIGVDNVLTLYVCMYVSALERKRLIGMT